MSNLLIYDPRYHTFESWACLMVELYAAQNLAIPTGNMTWRQWAEGLKAIDVFTNEGIPGPGPFTDWQEWAAAVMNAINASVN